MQFPHDCEAYEIVQQHFIVTNIFKHKSFLLQSKPPSTAHFLLQVSWLSGSFCPPCWTPANSGSRIDTTDRVSVWSTGFDSDVTPITLDLSATSCAGLVMTSSATLAATPVAQRSAWRAGQDQSAKKVKKIFKKRWVLLMQVRWIISALHFSGSCGSKYKSFENYVLTSDFSQTVKRKSGHFSDGEAVRNLNKTVANKSLTLLPFRHKIRTRKKHWCASGVMNAVQWMHIIKL